MNRYLPICIFVLALTIFFSCAEQEQIDLNATPTAQITFDVQGMTCAGCEVNVKLALKDVEGIKKVEPSYEGSEAKLTVNPELIKEEAVVDALSQIGYTAKKKESSSP